MKKSLLSGAFALSHVFGLTLLADPLPGENQFTPISTRNVFGLQPAASNAPVDPTSALQPAKIIPNGIITLFGKPQVLFKVLLTPLPGQPPAKEHSYLLSEGERQDDIQVQKIDAQAALITFNNHGMIQELSLTSDAAAGGDPGAAPVGAPRRRLVSARLPGVDTTQPVSKEEYFRNLGIAANPSHFTGPDGDPMATDRASETTLTAPAVDSTASGAYARQNRDPNLPSANGGAGNTYSPAPLTAQQDAAGGDVPDGGDSPLPPPRSR
jgi:hypothetical protein